MLDVTIILTQSECAQVARAVRKALENERAKYEAGETLGIAFDNLTNALVKIREAAE